MCSVSSCSLTDNCSLVTILSSTNCAVRASRVRLSMSASNSSALCPSAARKSSLLMWACSSWCGERVLAALDLGLHDALRQRHVDLGEQRLQGAVAGLHALLEPAHLVEAGAQVVAQLVERVELARRLGELVVELGQLTLLDGVDGDGHLGVLAGVVATDEGGRERPRTPPPTAR